MTQQLTFFSDMEVDNQRRELAILKDQVNSTRKALFGNLDEVTKDIAKLREEMRTLFPVKGPTLKGDDLFESTLLEIVK